MYKDFIGWSLENIGKGTVETKYTVEYVNDKKVWNKFLRTEDIELFSKREYNNIAEALTFYLTWYVNENCFYIQLWEQIYVNGEMILEEMIEPEGSMKYHLRNSIDKEMHDRVHKSEMKVVELEKANGLYRAFIKMLGQRFEDMFYEFYEYVERESKNEQ